jgi:hypothetical protein
MKAHSITVCFLISLDSAADTCWSVWNECDCRVVLKFCKFSYFWPVKLCLLLWYRTELSFLESPRNGGSFWIPTSQQ